MVIRNDETLKWEAYGTRAHNSLAKHYEKLSILSSNVESFRNQVTSHVTHVLEKNVFEKKLSKKHYFKETILFETGVTVNKYYLEKSTPRDNCLLGKKSSTYLLVNQYSLQEISAPSPPWSSLECSLEWMQFGVNVHIQILPGVVFS